MQINIGCDLWRTHAPYSQGQVVIRPGSEAIGRRIQDPWSFGKGICRVTTLLFRAASTTTVPFSSQKRRSVNGNLEPTYTAGCDSRSGWNLPSERRPVLHQVVSGNAGQVRDRRSVELVFGARKLSAAVVRRRPHLPGSNYRPEVVPRRAGPGQGPYHVVDHAAGFSAGVFRWRRGPTGTRTTVVDRECAYRGKRASEVNPVSAWRR